jgi:glycosyltransferase involved in cell wall biosynthesis
MIRVLNVNDSLALKTGGGTAERTFQISRFLAKAGAECTVLVLNTDLDNARIEGVAPAVVVALPCLWGRFRVPRLKLQAISELVSRADIVHLMGHWSVLNAMIYFVLRRARVPYVVCPAGALPLFGRSRLLKRIYNAIIGKALIRNASGWVAVTASEIPHFNEYGIPSARISILPNGVSAEDFECPDTDKFLLKHRIQDVPLILFMGRLNPIKGPDLLLKAFIRVCGCLDRHHLVFVGPDGGMLAELRELADQAGVTKRVHFLGFLSGEEKCAAYHVAHLLVVPSRQEAMSIVALEAGICGTPALMTDQCGFAEIRTVDPRLEVPASVEGLAGGLLALLDGTDACETIASDWRDFVVQKYAWTSIAPKFISLYREILVNSTNA